MPDMGIPYSVFEEGTLMWELGSREKQHSLRGSSHPLDTKGRKGRKAALSSWGLPHAEEPVGKACGCSP